MEGQPPPPLAAQPPMPGSPALAQQQQQQRDHLLFRPRRAEESLQAAQEEEWISVASRTLSAKTVRVLRSLDAIIQAAARAAVTEAALHGDINRDELRFAVSCALAAATGLRDLFAEAGSPRGAGRLPGGVVVQHDAATFVCLFNLRHENLTAVFGNRRRLAAHLLDVHSVTANLPEDREGVLLMGTERCVVEARDLIVGRIEAANAARRSPLLQSSSGGLQSRCRRFVDRWVGRAVAAAAAAEEAGAEEVGLEERDPTTACLQRTSPAAAKAEEHHQSMEVDAVAEGAEDPPQQAQGAKEEKIDE